MFISTNESFRMSLETLQRFFLRRLLNLIVNLTNRQQCYAMTSSFIQISPDTRTFRFVCPAIEFDRIRFGSLGTSRITETIIEISQSRYYYEIRKRLDRRWKLEADDGHFLRRIDRRGREVTARRSQDYRSSGLADYLNANTMLYRGALFPSRLFYNSICDPGASPARRGGRGRGEGGGRDGRSARSLARSLVRSFIVTLLNLRPSTVSIRYPSLRAHSLSFFPPTPAEATTGAHPSFDPLFHLARWRTRRRPSLLFSLFLSPLGNCTRLPDSSHNLRTIVSSSAFIRFRLVVSNVNPETTSTYNSSRRERAM